VINQDEKSRLIVSLLGMFESARADSERAALRPNFEEPKESPLSNNEQEALLKFKETLPVTPKQPMRLIPQACALLLSTGQIVGGVASNPITCANLKAEDAVQIALNTLESNSRLYSKYNIVAVAMTISADQPPAEEILDLFEHSLSELPNLKAQKLILVDPSTKETAYSAPFSDYRIL